MSLNENDMKRIKAEMNKAMKHIEITNSEMGSVDIRLGRIEGALNEALPNIRDDLKAVFTKFDNLPCSIHGERIKHNETLMKNIIKTRYLTLTALLGGVITYAVSILLKVFG